MLKQVMVAMEEVTEVQVHDGEDKFIEVPLGTVVRDKETDEILFEITERWRKKILCKVEKVV